jgi:hypothetical protein
LRAGLADATFEQKRRLVELLIDRVIVIDEEVEIRYVIPTSSDGPHQPFCHLRTDYLDGFPRREVVEQEPPSTSAADDVEDGVEDLARGSVCAAIVPESLEVVPPEEKHRIYKMLRMKVLVNKEGTVAVEIVSGKAPEPDTGSVKSGGLCS